MSMSRQRALWLFGLTGILGAASGCVESDAPAFTVGWEVVYVDVNDRGAQVSCKDAGTPTVELTMTNLSSHRSYINTFNCDSHGADSEPLPGGRYSVKIALKNLAGQEMSNIVGEWTLVRDGLTDLGVISFPIQSFNLSWTLARGPNSLRCQDVDATTVNIITRLNSEPEVTYAFPCTAGSGSTPAIAVPGTYSVRLQLVSSTGAVLWDTDMPMTIPVDGRERAVLPSVRFDL
jgi:hypothetical protein